MVYLWNVLIIASFVVLVGISIFPRFYLRNHPTVTSEEITTLSPGLVWVKYIYHSIAVLVVLFYISLLFILEVWVKIPTFPWVLIIIGPLLIGLYEGLFSTISNVYPMTSRRNWNLFIYDHSKKMRWIAKTQVGLNATVLMICVLILLFGNR